MISYMYPVMNLMYCPIAMVFKTLTCTDLDFKERPLVDKLKL
jgi:hypothetical protein